MSALHHSQVHLVRSSSAHVKCRILVDFDGTVAPDDPTDRLFERFADPIWRDIEDAWQAGRISSRECMRRQVALLRATPEELDEEIRNVRVDPGFRRFVGFCSRQGMVVTIVSDGLDRLVRAVLERERLSVPFFANRLEWCGSDRWRLAFPHARRDCRVGGANCKCSHGARPRTGRCVVIGDGRSDFCMSAHADFVIAKGTLEDFCRRRGLSYGSFKTFDHVTTHVSKWLETSLADAAPD
jgi:2-hydroxy-3-keto-5-methylthiopentenyl-1-phosphate phosphatase